MKWISVKDELPKMKGKDYQVAVISVKVHKHGNYKNQGIIAIVQDWVVREWKDTFTHWMPLPDPPQQEQEVSSTNTKEKI